MKRASVILKPREDIRIRKGHPWVYDNEIARQEGEPEAGDEVFVKDSRGKLLGTAFYNPASKIRARIFSQGDSRADLHYFRKGFRDALAWRSRFFDTKAQSLRAVFGEADGLPGLIVDLFTGVDASAHPGKIGPKVLQRESKRWASVQFLSLGMEKRKADILEAIAEVFSPSGIVERSDAPVRALEGLPPFTGILSGAVPDSILMEENGAVFAVDLAGGQKTGWFLDQRANRAAAARHADDRDVLDVFCNQGGFGILAAMAGARSVAAVDSSPAALAAAARNAELNGVADRFVAIEDNAFDRLRSLEKEKASYGLVILDPPAFAKSRSAVESAHRGYKEINVRAMRLLQPGGILVTCSCSHWFDPARFDSMLAEAAFDCGRRFRIIEERGQDLDHPIVSGYGESRYLKCRILELD